MRKIFLKNLNFVDKSSIRVLNYFLGSLGMGYWTNLLSSKQIIFVFSCIVVFFSLTIIIEIPTAKAETEEYEFNVIEGDDIKNDPTAQHILKQIELSKKILAQLQSERITPLTEHQKFVEEQRKIAQEKLDVEVQRMNKKYEAFTPENAFASYVSNKPDYMQKFYWDQFNYLNNKVSLAKQQRDFILENGGSYQQAQQIFIQYATFPKSEVKSVFDELVEKHDLYDHYAGEIDSDKWYPEEAVQLFESWSKKDNQNENIADVQITKELSTNKETNETIQNISFESAFEIFENQVATTMPLNSLDPFEIDTTDAIELNGQNFNEINGNVLNDASEFTASAWINPDYKKGSSTFTILEKPGVFQLTVNNYVEPRHVVKFSVFDGIKWNTIQSFSTIDEKWTHVAGVLKDSRLSLYVNGNLEAMYHMGGTTSLNSKGMIEKLPLELKTSSEPINVGVQKIIKLDERKTKNYFSGLIDDVLIHNKALTVDEFYENKNL